MLLKYYLKWLILKKKPLKLRRWIKPYLNRYQLYSAHDTSYNGSTKQNFVQTQNFFQLFIITSMHREDQRDALDMYSLWSFLYRQQYLSSLLKLPVQLRNINIQSVVPADLVLYMVHSARSIKWKRYHIMHGNEIIELLFLSLWLKN